MTTTKLPLKIAIRIDPKWLTDSNLAVALGQASDVLPDYWGDSTDTILYLKGDDGELKMLARLIGDAVEAGVASHP